MGSFVANQILQQISLETAQTITDEAFALLKYNLEYLISVIIWKPLNVTTLFAPTPNIVTISWTPEYSSTLLPNGGGYDVYRALVYEGYTGAFAKVNTTLIQTNKYLDNYAIPQTIPQDKNVFLKYYVIAKSNANVYSTPSDTISLFVGKTVTGTIAANTIWNSNKIVIGNISVSNGTTLTISPGTTVRFNTGKSITSNGELNAVGTGAQPITFVSISRNSVGSWGSVQINGAGAINSKISYATFKYGSELSAYNVLGSGNGIEVSYCVFDTMINAVRFNNSKGTVKNCVVTMPRDHGLIMDNVSTAMCYENTLTKLNKSGAAVIYSGGAIGNAWKNKVNGFNWGLASYWGAMPVFGASTNTGINNSATNCIYGLNIYNWSYPDIGLPAHIDSGTTYGNSVYANTKNVNIYTTPDDTVYAQYVYWGTSTPSTTFQIGSGVKYFDARKNLPQNPWQGNIESRSTFLKRVVRVTPGEPRTPYDAGIQLRFQRRFTDAAAYFSDMIARDNNDIRAYIELYKSQHATTQKKINDIFTKANTTSPALIKYLKAGLLMKSGDFQKAKQYNQTLLQEDPGNIISARALVGNFYIALYAENQFTEAQNILKQIRNTPGLVSDIELSILESSLDLYTGYRPIGDKTGGN